MTTRDVNDRKLYAGNPPIIVLWRCIAVLFVWSIVFATLWAAPIAKTVCTVGDVNAATGGSSNGTACVKKPLRVLMIGNSFSISCMKHIPMVAKSLGLELDITSMYIGGSSLRNHANNIASKQPDYTPYLISRNRCGKECPLECIRGKVNKSNIPQVLKCADWDVVTIQQASGQSWCPETYRPYGDQVVKTIRDFTPGAEIVMQQTWSYAVGEKRMSSSWRITQNEMYEKLRCAYRDFAAVYGLRIIPMGEAVQEWRKRLPVKGSEGDVVGNGKDFAHLGSAGEYFQALLWTAFLFDVDVSQCAYRPEFVSEKNNALMKQIVSDVLKSSKKK